MSGHTPGPWEVGVDSGLPEWKLSIDAPHAKTAWYGLAVVNDMRDPAKRTGEAVANARLIAAAPELLGALRKVSDELESVFRHMSAHSDELCQTYGPTVAPVLGQAHDAIAAATEDQS